MKNGANIRLTGASPTASIGGVEHSVVNTKSALTAFNIAANAGKAWVIADDIDLSGSTYATQVLSFGNTAFTGTLDGFGNRVRKLTASGNVNLGLFNNLGASTVRNLGVTEAAITVTASSTAMMVGPLAATVSGAAAVDQVWATGSLKTAAGTYSAYGLGGLIGNVSSGKLTLTRSWSSVNLDTSLTTASSFAVGGLIAANVVTLGQSPGSNGGAFDLEQVYTTGSIKVGTDAGWRGTGGIVGMSYSNATTKITDAFSWGRITGPNAVVNNSGGILGVSTGTSVVRAYTSTSGCVNNAAYTGCTANVVPGTTGTFNTSAWGSTNGTTLTNLAPAVRPLYVQPVAPTNGAFGTVGYKIIDGTGNDYTSSLATYNLSVSGTSTWDTISASSPVSATPYSVKYVTGLTLGGSAASSYSLNEWTSAISITISKTTQTVTWSPTTALLRTATGNAVAAATTTGDSTITYTVSTGTAGCTFNAATRQLQFSTEGTCSITATAPETANFTGDSVTKTFVISTAPPLAPTGLTVTGGSANGTLAISWTAPSTATTGGTIASYTLEVSSDGTNFSSVATGITATSYTATGLTNGASYTYRVRAVNNLSETSPWLTASTSSKPYYLPINLTAPTITGVAVGGLTLTASVGTWDDNGSALSGNAYQWQISTDKSTWTTISEATAGTYVPTASQAGKYLRVTVTKTNAAGDTSAASLETTAVLSGLAAAPTSLVVTRGNQQLGVSWVAPSTTNGGTISAYTVQYRASGVADWTSASSNIDAAATTYTITGLTNGTAYDVRVFATTAAGAGPDVATAQTVTPANAPTNSSPPTIFGVAAAARTLTAAIGTWAANGNPITSYTYQWQVSDTGASGDNGWANVSTGGTAATYVPSSIEVGKYLRVIVGAVNDVGTTTAVSVATTVVQSGLATAPTALTPTAGDAQLSLTWQAPVELNGGVISAYVVKYRAQGASSWSTASNSVAANVTSYTIAGLTNAMAYDVQVFAVTGAGEGATVTYSADESSTPFTKPANSVAPSVSGTVAVARALSSTNGAWADNGRTIAYTYQWQVSADGVDGWASVASAGTSATYTPVTADAGKFLRLAVTATNTAGAVTAFSLATSVVQSGLAAAPTALTPTAGDAQLSLTWQAPVELNGGVISAYVVKYRAQGASSWSTASNSVAASATSYTITGLTNATAYDVQVFAVTGAGEGATVIHSADESSTPFTVPSNSIVPTVTGTVAVARTLSSTVGTWADNGRSTSYSYQWQVSANGTSSWDPIAENGTNSTYVIAAADGGKYLRLAVTATNAAGSVTAYSLATEVVVTGLAAAPTVLTSTAGDAQLTLGWQVPGSLNGGEISDYEVQYSVSGANSWTTVRVGSTATSLTLTGLTNATAYDWRVAAVTAAGIGALATYSSDLDSTPFTKPTNSVAPSVSGTVAVARALTSTNGTWADNGRTIAYTYQWQISDDGVTSWRAVSSDGTSDTYAVKAADAGKYLRLSVTATNSAGSVTANSLPTSVVESGLAGSVGTLTATRGDTELLVGWNAPTELNGATAITGYRIQYSVDETNWTTAPAPAADSTLATTYTITGLTNGTLYMVRVDALTAAGYGEVAMPVSATPSGIPILTGAPSISGTATVGVQLSADPGTWNNNGDTATFSYEWQTSTTGTGGWSTIADATASTYTPVAADAKQYLRVVVTASNVADAATPVSSASTAAVLGAPVITVAPVVTMRDGGTGGVGTTLSATTGEWNDYGLGITSYGIQWQRSADKTDWIDITGATFETYTLATADAGQFVRVRVSATSSGGVGTASTLFVGSASSGTIGSGLATAPSSLTALPTDGAIIFTWVAPLSANGGELASYTIQYSTNGTTWTTALDNLSPQQTEFPLSGLTNGTQYDIRIFAKTAAGDGAIATLTGSLDTTPFGAPISTTLPGISGALAVGETLTAVGGTWNTNGRPLSGATRFAWFRVDGSNVTRLANASTYTVTGEDLGKSIRVVEFADNAGGGTEAKSADSAAIQSGIAAVPSALTALYSPVKLSLEWTAPTDLSGASSITNYRVEYSTNGTDWMTATSSLAAAATTYTLTDLTVGERYFVRVSALTLGGTGTPATTTSVLYGAVPSNTLAPSLSGTTAVLETLAADDGTWSGNGAAITGTTYQWQRSTDGTVWSPITGATSATYTLTPADAQQFVRVLVTKTNLIGSASEVSAASTQIGAGPATAPRDLTLTRAHLGLDLNWVAPAELNGGTLVNYSVQYSTDGTNWVDAAPASSTALSLTGLVEGKSYRVRVRAETEVSGLWVTSAPVAVIALATSTGIPTISGTPLLGEQFTATPGTWNAHGAEITAYSYQWQTSPTGQAPWTALAGATSSQVTIDPANVYYRVQVRATNEAGISTDVSTATASAFTVTEKAAAPDALVVTPADTALSVTWQAPTQLGGGTISNYTVQYSTDNQSWTSLARSNNVTTSAVIAGLTNGTPYFVRVAAETSILGTFALTSAAVVPFGAPINTAQPGVSGTLMFDQTVYATGDTWAANGGTLSTKSYQWQSSRDGGANWLNIEGATSSSYRIGEVVGENLRVQVTQRNVEGSMTTVSSDATAVVAAAAAGAPTNISAIPGDETITLSWSNPTSLGGSLLTKYVVEYSVNRGDWVTVERADPKALTETITGLTNGEQYTVRVSTFTAISGNSVLVSSTTPFGKPITSVVPSLTGTARFDETLLAAEGVWDSNGSTITNVSYQWQYSSNGTTWANIASANGSTYKIGPYVGKQIRVLVTTTNAAGQTKSASVPTSIVAAASPNAATGLNVTAGDTTLDLEWVAPSYTGGAPITNYEIEYSADGITWMPATRTPSTDVTQQISNLSNGTAYTVRVRALNGALGAWATSTTFTPFGTPISTELPKISGTVAFASTLAATEGVWNANGSSVTSTSFQWQYSVDGSSWTDIPSATASTYTVGDHVGHTIRVLVTARNLRGVTSHISAATATVIADSASAPLTVRVQSSDQQLSLDWQAPTYLGGADITNYEIEYSVNGGATTEWMPVSRASSIATSQTITGLTNGASYAVRVRALNGVSGEWATVSAAGTPFGLPQVVTAGSVPTVRGNLTYGETLTAINTEWSGNGSSLTSMTTRWQVESGGSWIDIAGANTASYQIAGFIGSRVRAVVTATNAAGSVVLASAPSATIAAAAAGSPTSITATAEDSAINVTWVAPTNTGGAPITNYTVEYSTDARTWQPVSRTASTETSQRITGLANGTSYYVSIRAQNGSDGRWGFLATTVVPRGLPVNTVAPALAGTPQFQGTMSVDDGAWNENGDSIDAVTYQWQYSTDDGKSWSNIAGATKSSYAVGLYVGSMLRASVRATNAAGIQAAVSTPSAEVTAIPAATPVITSQTVGSNTVRVGWTPPAHSGGIDLVGYTLQYSTDSSNWTTMSFGPNETSATLTGLTNGTGYLVRVRGETNQAGAWSPVAGPFTPVAPIVPIRIAPSTTSPTPAPTSTQTTTEPALAPSSLLEMVMPRLVTSGPITSLTGAPEIIITSDGRIELQPSQSVALVDGSPVAAQVAVSGNQVSIDTGTTSIAMTLGSSTGSTGSTSQSNTTTESSIMQGSDIAFTGAGFAPNEPVVTWIQSDPIKLGEARANASGEVTEAVKITDEITPGQHTIQINGFDVTGRVVSLIYGVNVIAQTAVTTAGVDAPIFTQPWVWMLMLLLLVIVMWLSIRFARRRARSLQAS